MNRTIYLTKEQDLVMERAKDIIQQMPRNSGITISGICVAALSQFVSAGLTFVPPIAIHVSKVQPETVITVDTGINIETARWGWFVRIRTANNIVHEERGFLSETGARERFEKIVDAHERGESIL